MSGLRIDLVAPPMAGHLHPLLGIGRRLAQEHQVRVVSTANALREITAAGLAGVAVLPGGDAVVSSIVNPPRPVRSNPWRLHAQLAENLSLLGRLRDELLQHWARDRPDLVIADFSVPVAGAAATALGLRWWTTTASPCVIETPDGPPAYLGGWHPGRGLLGRLRDALGRAAVRGFKHTLFQLHRRVLRDLGFASLYRADGTERIYSPERVFALSVAEIEFPRRLPPWVELVGPVLYTPPHEAPAPPFVPGRRHVLVSLGTHVPWRKDAVAEAVRRAAREVPEVEFHFSDGDRWSSRHEQDGNFHRLAYVPYPVHVGRYNLVFHHAGAGVLGFTLAAGKPALMLPVDFDQFDLAARLEAAGLALRVRDLRHVGRLTRQALADAALAARCQALSRRSESFRGEERIAERVRELPSS